MKPASLPMDNAPRCGAKNRQGKPCQSPAMRGKKRCRLHGGKSPGAPLGNQNALKHGYYSAEAIEARRMTRRLLREARDLMAAI
ncbi:MAG TPA: hypothetical protein DCG48_04005 [Rhodospirillaceae bacterium]|nr:hypothetical protein [Rhodospirillaceae bacterium]